MKRKAWKSVMGPSYEAWHSHFNSELQIHWLRGIGALLICKR